ncbi:hypothetical protein K8Q98_02810, partial [Candidatus Nomurabacteria bacterium]|nr:hypothetical protein [Candidatus Nomurabacteria bacterium]
MLRKVVFFVCFILIFSAIPVFSGNAAFDCLTLQTTSSNKDKDYCKGELAQIEAELAHLLELQKEQQKQTGTLTGD